MFTIELLPRESVLQDILPAWEASGRTYDSAEGINFDAVTTYAIDGGVLRIASGDNIYFYNIADFYRVKIQAIQDDMFTQ